MLQGILPQKRTKTPEQFRKEVYERVGDEYTFLDDYDGAHTKIRCRHNKCGHVWETKPNVFLMGHGCPKCGMEPFIKLSKEVADFYMIALMVEQKSTGRVSIVQNEYKGTAKRSKFHCNECGREWRVISTDFIDGHGCPRCACSRREDYINDWLTRKGIEFTPTNAFSGLP